MAHESYIGGAWVQAKKRERFIGGSWRMARTAEMFDGTAWRQYFTGVVPMTVSISPNPLLAFTFNNTTVTGSVTASVTDGLAPFTYSWAVISHSSFVSPTIINSATASPTLRQTNVTSETSETAVFRVTVTDNTGLQVASDLSADFYNNSLD